jgi:alpha-1,6-mannosyltransferase
LRDSTTPAVKVHLVDISLFYPARTGGVRTYLRAKSCWLRQKSTIRHTIIAPVRRDDDDPDLIAIPSFPIPFGQGFRWPLSAALATRRLISLQPQLIEAGDPYQFAWSAIQARDKLNIAALAFYHSDLPQLASRRMGALGQLAAENYLRKLYAHFDLVLAPSRASLHKLQAIGIRQARHQPLGVDTEIFAPGRRDPWLKRRLGLPADCRLLVYAGRFSREKNLAALIAAVEHLGHPYHLLLIGGGSRISASGRVSCLPYQEDASALASLIGGADAFVHPGQHETFGLVVLEAMACSLPVLGVEGGGVAELVDADTGLLAESGSSASLAEGIRSLFSADLPAMGRRARQKAVVRYGWDCIMPQLMRHYETLLGSGQVRLAELTSLRTETR